MWGQGCILSIGLMNVQEATQEGDSQLMEEVEVMVIAG